MSRRGIFDENGSITHSTTSSRNIQMSKMLNSKSVNELKNLIQNSFRIRPNHDPIYIDVSNHLDRLRAKQHQVIYGRRGSGKSCLLVHFKNKEAPKLRALTIYEDVDEIKRLGYPDVLIRLLLSIMENIPSSKQWWRKFFFMKTKVQKHIDSLRILLNQADKRQVKQEDKNSKGATAGGGYNGANVNLNVSNFRGTLSEFQENKLDTLERYLSDYKSALIDELKKSKYNSGYVILDDFYLIKKDRQPDVIDYIHRLLRGTDFYLKVGTVRHRTKLIRNDQQTIGVELQQDIEEVNLDRTLEDLSSPTEYLSRILNKMGEKVSLENPSVNLFNQQALEKLVIASGGVPRDFLTIFVEAVNISTASNKFNHLTPTTIWKAASSLSYRNKLKNLRNDVSREAANLENVFRDLMRFCIQERKKTCFLISQDECQKDPFSHEMILQLMDFKLIHVVEPDTSAASGRQGRFEAYTLDFSLFMEPRKRNIEIIEFWLMDANRSKKGVRESPVYSLDRVKNAINANDNHVTEEFIDSVDGDSSY